MLGSHQARKNPDATGFQIEVVIGRRESANRAASRHAGAAAPRHIQ
jgi:hypothetical protein